MKHIKNLLFAFFALAFLIKALIPYGFMPNFETEQKTALTPIVICAGLNEKIVFLNEKGEFENTGGEEHTANSECEFSLASVFTASFSEILITDVDFYKLKFSQNYTQISNQTVINYYQSRAPPFLNA